MHDVWLESVMIDAKPDVSRPERVLKPRRATFPIRRVLSRTSADACQDR